MASTDARPIPRKNAAYRITFPIFDADGDLVTGATGLDSEISKDGGTFADCTNEATEIATSSGMYYLDLTATEMNADTVAIIVKTSSSGAKTTPIVLYPEEAGDIRVNITQVNGTNQTAGDLAAMITAVDDFVDTEVASILAAVDTEVAAIKAKTDNLPADPADASDIASSFSGVNTKLDTIDDFLDTEIAAIKAKTDNLPTDPADASDIATSFSGVNTKLDTIDDFLDTEIAAIKAKTDNLPASPAAVGSAMTLTSGERTAIANEVEAQIIDDTDSEKVLQAIIDKIASVNPSLDDLTLAGIASAVRTELTTELARIDAAVSSRLASGTVASDVTAIKAKTDNLPSDPADASVVAGLIAGVETKVDTVDTIVDAIKITTDKLDDTVEDDAGTYRFTENALEQAPSGGGGGGSGPTAAQIADAVWDEVIDDHLRDRSFGAKIGVHLSAPGSDIDYKRIKNLIDTAIENQRFPEVKEFDPTPISEALQALFEEVRAIDIPKAEKADFTPVLRRLDDVDKAVKAIKIPETDLSPIERHLDKQDKIIKPQVEEIRDTLEQMLERVRQYFEGDMEAFKREVESIKETFENIPYVVMEVKDKPKPTGKEEPKKSSLDEYLKLK